MSDNAAKKSDAPAMVAQPAPRQSMEGRTSPNAPHLPFPILGRAPAPQVQRDVINVALAAPGEPEEKPVERVHSIGVQLTRGGRPLPGILGQRQINAAVSEDYGTAGALAQDLRTRCACCVHFDPNRARPFIEAAIAKMRQGILIDDHGRVRPYQDRQAAWGVLIAREGVVKQLGICNAISEVMKNHTDGGLRSPWLVHPDGGCPAPAQLRGPGGEDLSGMFKARERSVSKVGDHAYDTVLGLASGKGSK